MVRSIADSHAGGRGGDVTQSCSVSRVKRGADSAEGDAFSKVGE